jgi:hypothetical protein
MMSDIIKSAREIALEKIEKLGGASEDEKLRWKYVPEGEKIAARYLREDSNLATELSKFEEKARKYVIAGAQDILIRNINLPRNDAAKKANKKAMEGLKVLKTDKVAAENLFSRIRRVFEHYVTQGEQQRKQAYESLKIDFAAKVQQAMRQQLGIDTAMKIDVERQPQFQEEWRRLQAQLDLQYIKLLDEYKKELAELP